MIFKIHYGLWYGGLVGIIPFMFNYAVEYSNASGTQHGVLYTVLPFIALLAKPVVCSLADKYAAHHHCLLFFIFTTILGYGPLAVYPFFPDLIQNHKNIMWILYCIAALVGNTSMCIVNSIGDSLAINSSQKRNVSYGEYRLWGPVGFGIFGAIWGVANEIPSMPKYTPGIITMVVILIINSLVMAFWYDKAEFKVLHHISPPTTENGSVENSNYESTQFEKNLVSEASSPRPTTKDSKVTLLWKLSRSHGSIYAYLFLFTFCGVMTGIHWQFFFKYLEQVASKEEKNFSTIATLALPVQALGGELVFFMFSGRILRKLGSSLTLVLSLFSFAARYLLYAYLIPNISMYWILPVELLQGPAFGLMYSVLTHQANYYSQKIDAIVALRDSGDVQLRNSLHATLQGVLGAAFEGLGLGLGAIIGGRAYDASPIFMWQIAGFSALVVSLICLFATVLSPLFVSFRRQESKSSDVTPAELDGISGGLVLSSGNEYVSERPTHLTPDESVLEELRHIAKSCHSDVKPPMAEVRSRLEELSSNLASEPAQT